MPQSTIVLSTSGRYTAPAAPTTTSTVVPVALLAETGINGTMVYFGTGMILLGAMALASGMTIFSRRRGDHL